MNQDEQNQLVDALKAEAGIDWPAGQILLCHQSRYYDLGHFIRIDGFHVGRASEYNPKGEPTQVPVLEVVVTRLSGWSEQPDFIWSDTSTRIPVRDVLKSEWIAWSGSYQARLKDAVAQLDNGVNADMQQELAGLLANEEADQGSQQTGLLARSSKAYYQTMLAVTEARRREIIILSTLMQLEISRRMGELNKVMAQANALMSALVKKVERIRRVITIIELYLGVDEELHQLRDGTPAEGSEPITFRQRCLFMDEEIAVKIGFKQAAAFDFQTIEVFDEWILQADHLDYLLPEKRGIVALRPRRMGKDYGFDSFVNAMLNKENMTYTYFLIRDGERVHRIFTHKLVVIDRLFPKRTELAQMFERHQTITFERDKEKLADDMHQYRKRATFMQGLLDRTNVFGRTRHPVNLFSLNPQTESLIQFIYDDDDNLLTDGKPLFAHWLREKNASIQPGSRVLLTGRYSRGYASPKEFMDRLAYYCHEYRVPPLPPAGLYAVEKPASVVPWGRYDKELKDLVIRYNPGDEVGISSWGEYNPHARKNRISWAIRRSDPFILHYDIISADECRYYLFSRSNRSAYLSMLPVLETLMNLREKEEAAEGPFIQLVLDECQRKGIPANGARVGELVRWWKTKNQYKRAIDVDDAKALRMIVRAIHRGSSKMGK